MEDLEGNKLKGCDAIQRDPDRLKQEDLMMFSKDKYKALHMG